MKTGIRSKKIKIGILKEICKISFPHSAHQQLLKDLSARLGSETMVTFPSSSPPTEL